MLTGELNKITAEIKRFGLFNFCQFKVVEYYYRHKFKSFGVKYPENQDNQLTANRQPANNDFRKNQSSTYFAIKRAFSNVSINFSQMSLLDIGCGDGKVLNLAMQLKCKNVVGIDIDEKPVNQTIYNCKQMQAAGSNVPFNIYRADASNYTIPPGTNVIYMFNPFGEKTMTAVVNNIISYQRSQKEDLYVIYIVAVHKNIFLNHRNCKKIYELKRKGKSETEVVVFKIINE